MLALCYYCKNELWQFTIKLYLTFTVRLYVSVGDLYLYGRKLNIDNNYVSIYVPIGTMFMTVYNEDIACIYC